MNATRDEAAAAVLGAVFLADVALDAIIDERVRPVHFHRERERAVFEAMLALKDQGEPVDRLTVTSRLEPDAARPPWRDPLDMRATVDVLAGSVPDVGNLRGYCRIVKDHAWFDRAGRALHAAGDALGNRNREALFAALADIDEHDSRAAASVDSATEFVDWYEADQKGIPLPFPELTEAVGGGLTAGEVTMLGGWPGMGKTFLLKDILLEATKAGARCHEYANETTGPRRTARLITSLTGIPTGRIIRKQLTASDWERVLKALNALPYETTKTSGWAVEDYCREMRRNKWDLCAIDTVTRLPCRKVDEWDRASGMLADTAAQTGTHLILLCQLNLGRETTAIRNAPVGRDLRNTGAWYQDARVVMFVHRDQELREEIPVALPDGHIRVDKATHGDASEGFVNVTFNPRWLKFDRLDDFSAPVAA